MRRKGPWRRAALGLAVALSMAVAVTATPVAAGPPEKEARELPGPLATSEDPPPAPYGYIWIDSDEPNGPVYTPVDITGTGTMVVAGDDEANTVTLGAPFSLYGDEATELWATTNGLLTTDPGGDPVEWLYGYCASYHNAFGFHLILVNNTDLVGEVYYQYFTESPVTHPDGMPMGASVFQWEVDYYWDSDWWSGTWEPDFTVWAILFDNGDFVVQIGSPGSNGRDDTIGVQSAVGSDSLQVTCFGSRSVPDEYAILFTTRPTPDTVGMVDPATGQWYLHNEAGEVSSFYYGDPGDYPFVGDWNCDGVETPGLYRQSDGYVYLRNRNTQGNADIKFYFGDPGDVPLAGDFNGDGCDTVSLFRPSEGLFYVINELGEESKGLGAADYSFLFGDPGDHPVVGDWDGDGIDEVGMFREATGELFCRHDLSTGAADVEIRFGNPGDRFVAGDWGVVDGIDSPGVFRPADGSFYLQHTMDSGVAAEWFTFGESDWMPVAGAYGID